MGAKDDAKAIVAVFAARISPTVWTNINKSEVVSGLNSRIDNPDLIDQASTSLCGPADFTRDVGVALVVFTLGPRS